MLEPQTPPQEYKILRLCLGLNAIFALVFMAIAWIFISPGFMLLMYGILAATLLYSVLFLKWLTTANVHRVSVVFILAMLILESPALLLHGPKHFPMIFILFFTFVIMYNIILVRWPEVLALHGLLLAADLGFMLWPGGLFQQSVGLIGLDVKYAVVSVVIFHVTVIILGTWVVEVKRRTESQLRYMNTNLNRMVAEKVAEIQRADREARQYQEQLEKILRHSPVGVVIIDEQLNFLYTNGVHFKFEAAAAGVRELPGTLLPLQLLKDTLLQARTQLLLEGKEKLVGQRLEYPTPEGALKIIRYAYIAVHLEGENGPMPRLVLITEDITEEEGLRRELIQTEHLAELGKMAASLAHEINNPLAGIKLYIELLEQNLAAPEKRKQIFAILEHSIVRIDRIIKSFLSFSRQEQPRKEWINVVEVLQSTLDLAVNFKQFHQIHIATEFEDIPLIYADPYRLAQVFVNLLNNASDAMAEAGGRLKIACGQKNAHVEITFQDTGKGIRREDLPHIFTPFFTTKARGHGTGLGLSTSYGIIRDHGGHLEVESREGAGTTFTIRLPRDEENQ